MVQYPCSLSFLSRPVAHSSRPKTSSRQSPLAIGTLYIVATPIGNLEDVTLRAIRVLGDVALIAAEDTRRTARLLRHHGIHTATTSFHAHNERQKASALLDRLRRGQAVALVTDAGTPLLSDPGARLVQEALASGISVQPVPGASAILAALVMSGLFQDSFTFMGFPPHRSNNRIKWLQGLLLESRPLVVFEAPHRIRATLRDMQTIFGDRQVAVCREITKIHEKLVSGPISEVLQRLSEPRGEFTIVISPPKSTKKTPFQPDLRAIWEEFCLLTKHDALERRSAVSALAKKHGTASRSMYSALEEAKRIYGV